MVRSSTNPHPSLLNLLRLCVHNIFLHLAQHLLAVVIRNVFRHLPLQCCIRLTKRCQFVLHLFVAVEKIRALQPIRPRLRSFNLGNESACSSSPFHVIKPVLPGSVRGGPVSTCALLIDQRCIIARINNHAPRLDFKLRLDGIDGFPSERPGLVQKH